MFKPILPTLLFIQIPIMGIMKLISVKEKSVKLPINLHFIQLKNDFNLEAFFDWTQYTPFEMSLKCIHRRILHSTLNIRQHM